MSAKIAECISGILIDHGTILVEKRRADDEADPGLVFLPGGHVEKDETFGDALRREMREELGIRVQKSAPIEVHYHIATDGEKQRDHYFHVRKWSGAIRSMEADRVYWESRLNNLSDLMERRMVRKLLRKPVSRHETKNPPVFFLEGSSQLKPVWARLRFCRVE